MIPTSAVTSTVTDEGVSHRNLVGEGECEGAQQTASDADDDFGPETSEEEDLDMLSQDDLDGTAEPSKANGVRI